MLKIKAKRKKDRVAQAMLVAILMITAITLAIGLAVASLGSGQINMTVASRQASQAYALSEGCLEDALMRLARTDTTLPPSFTTPLGSCTIEVIGSAPYQITSKAIVGKANRIIKATVSVNNEVLNITKWEEIY